MSNLFTDFVMHVFNDKCTHNSIEFLEIIYRIASPTTIRPKWQQPYRDNYCTDWVGYADDVEMIYETIENFKKPSF